MRRATIALMLLLQIVFLVYVVTTRSISLQWLNTALLVMSAVAVLIILTRSDKVPYKTTWVFLILSMPLFGGLLYMMLNLRLSKKTYNEKAKIAEQKTEPLFMLPGSSYEEAQKSLGEIFSQVRYLQDYMKFPVYGNTDATYLPLGEKMFEALLPELKKAEKYIFLEYFIVQEGVMWDSILEILKQKAKSGVKVRFIYDDIGSFFLLPKDYPEQMREFGIECTIFNPFRPMLSASQNNRDHRKIIVIDGKVAFTGGINLADEYINALKRFGHWKDAGVMIRGKAAWSFALIFLQMWEICTGSDENLESYYPWSHSPCDIRSEGFVQPYADSPLDSEHVGEHVYMQILNQSQEYVYISTPYFVVDDNLLSAITLTAKRGVDVRIVTPHKWDKFAVHMTTRSYYRELIKAGVKVYEYSSGFIHSKTFVSDDIVATVGTTNLDFRSLYLNFECGTLLFKNKAVIDVKEDFLQTLKQCHLISAEECTPNVPTRLMQDMFRLFAPLM